MSWWKKLATWCGLASASRGPTLRSVESLSPADQASLERHIAGAIVIHQSPFSDLAVPISPQSQFDFPEWAQPLFWKTVFGPDDVLAIVSEHRAEVRPELLSALLSTVNWRPRVSATYLAVILQYREFEDDIGRLLLRSDVCFAGVAYCAALAHFDTPKAVDYLSRYLDHYLSMQDLWFEQSIALATLECLDETHGTAHAKVFEPRWQHYIADKPNLDLARSIKECRKRLERLQALSLEYRTQG